MQVTTTISDIALKYGRTEKGQPWTMATVNAADGKKYKTYDEALLEKAKHALTSAATVELTFVPTDKSFKDDRTGKQVPYTERELKEIVIRGKAAPAAHANDFQRQAQIAALQAAAQVMAACISAKTESHTFDKAMRIVQKEARTLYAATFGTYEKTDESWPMIGPC